MIDFFTKQERIFIIFLLAGVIIGSGLQLYRSYFKVNNNNAQQERLQNFERQIRQKAILIDSVLDGDGASAEKQNLISKGEKLLKMNHRGTTRQGKLLLDINSATVEELMQLPQVGKVTANKIVEYRAANGAFKNIEDIVKVKGIGEKKLTLIKPHIYVKNN